MLDLYGIPNCDTVKKARKLLEASGKEYNFHDFKKEAPSKKDLKEWKTFFGELPVNKRGTTFRKFKTDYEELTEAEKINLIIENPSLIKRPVLAKNGKILSVGFDQSIFEKA